MRKSKSFLAKLDKLNYRQRWAAIVEFVRDSNAATIESMQIELEDGPLFHQYVSLQISIVTRNGSRILNCVESESRLISTTAAAASLKCCTDDPEFVDTIFRAPHNLQQQLIKGVGRSENFELAEKVLSRAIESGPRTIAKLLPSCSAESVAEHLPDCDMFVSKWRLLVKRNPATVGQFIQRQFAESVVSLYPSLWYRFSDPLISLARSDEPLVVSLLDKYCDDVKGLSLKLQRLLMRLYKSHPDAIGKLILAKRSLKGYLKYGVPDTFENRAPQLTNEHLQVLVETLLPKTSRVTPLLNQLAPSRRREILDAIETDEAPLNADPAEGFLLALPHEIRRREVNQILELNGERLSPDRKASLFAMLEYEVAFPVLEKRFKSAQAEERASGYAYLVKCAALNGCLGDALNVLQRTANEQEPVRTAYLSQLQDCRPSVFNDDHVPLLASLIQSALEARDSSHATFSMIQNLLFKFMIHFDRESKLYELALNDLQEVGHRSGGIRIPRLASMLPAGREFDLVDSLSELMASSNHLERYDVTLQLARVLDSRGWEVPRLNEMLAEVLDAKQSHHRESAIGLWLANPSTRDQRIEKLLKSDLSVITQWMVWKHLHFRRQDLLEPFLRGTPIKGKFLSGKTVHLLPMTRDFYRWLPRQQTAFAKLLDRYAGRKNAANHEKHLALKTKANLTVSTLDDFSRELSTDDVVMLEAALIAIPDLDRIGAGAEVLASHLDSDRARIAMYALPRCLKEMPAEARLSTLKRLVGPGKVTVRKEAVRLMGRYSSEESAAILKQLVDSENLHRDVKIAVGHAAVQMLHRPQAWDLLNQLSTDENEDLSVSLLAADTSSMNRSQRVEFAKMLLELANHSSAKVRKAFFAASSRWQRQLSEPFAQAAAGRVLEIESAPEWILAANCLARCCDEERAVETVAQTIEELGGRIDEANAQANRDCPSLQRLRYLVAQIGSLPLRVRVNLGSTISNAADRLMSDFRTRRVGAELSLAAVQWNTDACGAQLDSLGRQLQKDPMLVGEFLGFFGQHLRSQDFALDEGLLPVVNSIGESDCTESRLLAVELLSRIGIAQRWPSTCRSRLGAFRSDEHVSVRRRAFSVFTSPESK